MSWLIEDLSATHNVELLTGTLRDTDVSKCRNVHTVAEIKRPRLFRYLSFLYSSTLRLFFSRRHFILTTSGDCWFANVIYAHFCCAQWLKMIRRGDVTLPSGTARRALRNLHYRIFLRVAAWHERRMYHRKTVRAIVAVSAQVKREIMENYRVSPDVIQVVPNAADDRVRMQFSERAKLRHKVRHRLGIDANACVFLFIAAADWKRKGLNLLLEARGQMKDKDSVVLVVGEEDIAHYREISHRHQIGDHVIFTGRVSDIAEVYAAADAFVYPSLYEAFPLVLLEAAAAELALVVTPMGGVEELGGEGRPAVVVERNAAALASVMDELATDPGKRRQLAQAAAQASQRFTRPAVATAFTEVLEAAAK